MMRPLVLASLLVALIPLSARDLTAQTIPIRTIPVASGDQFVILPSETLGMGGVRLAVDDSLADGWSNPAKGSFLSGSAFLGSPTVYSISDGGGGGRTFPVAGLFAGSTWWGGGALALQQIENGGGGGDRFIAVPDIGPRCFSCGDGGFTPLSERFGRNLYASGFVGRRLAGDWSIGLGGAIAQLRAMDGVDLLYAGSQRIDQSGSMSDLRVGLHHDGDRERLSLLLLHGRVSMTHDVTYVDWAWDDILMAPLTSSRVEVNQDQTRTFGGHLAWDRDLDAPGWRIGASGTINYKDHPKIPNYSLQNIPRDPGTTWAYEAAVGFARTDDETTFALDFAFQPIWSDTWQAADAQDAADSGGRLAVGDRSIENDFFFTNVMIRSGLSHDVRSAQLQTGLEIRSYAYHLEQVDRVENSYREQDETWIEWTPTFGVVFHLDALDLRYAGRVTTGTGRPSAFPERAAGPGDQLLGNGGDFIAAPEGPLSLQDARVVTHQLSVSIPIR